MATFTINVVLFLCLIILFVKPRYVLVVFMIGTMLTTYGVSLEIAGFDLFSSRLLEYFIFIRVVVRREMHCLNFKFNTDMLMGALVIIMLIAGIMLGNSTNEIFQRVAVGVDMLGVYLLFRIYITSTEDVVFFMKAVAIILIPITILMVIEKQTGINHFSILGGVSRNATMRGGKIRAQGPFPHAIMAGTIAAVMLPQYIALFFRETMKKFSLIAVGCILLMVYSCSSSGPIMSVLCCMVGFSVWKYRKNMRSIKWLLVFGLILAEIVMKGHFWYLLAKIDLTGSSTGWHRAELITQAINHFNEWWLCGTNFTRHWMPTGVGWDERHTDITNEFIYMGVNGGLLLLAVFVLVIVSSFDTIGKFFKTYDKIIFKDQVLVWSFGVSMFSHTVSFFSITYFGQAIIVFFMHVGLITQLNMFDFEEIDSLI